LESLTELDRRYARVYKQGNDEGDKDIKPPSATSLEEKTFHEYWGWFTILDLMAGGDFTKWNYFLDMGVVEFLNLLSFMRDKIEYQNLMNDNKGGI
jgi:hypothetical protein